MTPEEKAKKKLLADERKRKKAAEEYKALNNVVTPITKTGRAAATIRKNDKPRTSAQILKERKKNDEGLKLVRKSVKRIADGSSKRWRGWRDSEGQASPVTTYNINDDTSGG